MTTGTRTLLALIKMAVFDLGQFVEDLGGYVAALVAVAEGLVNLSCQLVATLFFAFLSALASFVSVVIGVGTSVYVTISSILDAIKQLTQVIMKFNITPKTQMLDAIEIHIQYIVRSYETMRCFEKKGPNTIHKCFTGGNIVLFECLE